MSPPLPAFSSGGGILMVRSNGAIAMWLLGRFPTSAESNFTSTLLSDAMTTRATRPSAAGGPSERRYSVIRWRAVTAGRSTRSSWPVLCFTYQN
jgi:hypothetical protein